MIEFVRKDRSWYMFIDGEYIAVSHIEEIAKKYFKFPAYNITLTVKTKPNQFNSNKIEAKNVKRENEEYIKRKAEGLIK